MGIRRALRQRRSRPEDARPSTTAITRMSHLPCCGIRRKGGALQGPSRAFRPLHRPADRPEGLSAALRRETRFRQGSSPMDRRPAARPGRLHRRHDRCRSELTPAPDPLTAGPRPRRGEAHHRRDPSPAHARERPGRHDDRGRRRAEGRRHDSRPSSFTGTERENKPVRERFQRATDTAEPSAGDEPADDRGTSAGRSAPGASLQAEPRRASSRGVEMQDAGPRSRPRVA